MNLLYPDATPTPIPEPTQAPIKTLDICLGSEPRSLYLYEAGSQDEQVVMQAITDGPIDVLSSGEEKATLLKSLPTIDNGMVVYTPFEVVAGDTIANSEGNLVALEAGIRVFPSGCRDANCVIGWDGVSTLQVDQVTVTFSLKDGLKWSDGNVLSANDSVFSFTIAADPATPTTKEFVDLTESYQALDEVTIEWKAVPGFITDEFAPFFWSPLPFHTLGESSASVLLDDEKSNRMPLSFGPFMIEEWQQGSFIRLVKNPNYHRAAEGLPATDVLTYKFLSANDPASLLTAAQAECDIVTASALDIKDIQYLSENAGTFDMKLDHLIPDTVEMLAIGITPSSYDDNYYPYGADRPDLFGDARVRQAVAYCIDQQTIVDKLLGSSGNAAIGFLPSENPLMAGVSLENYGYDPAIGITLLEQTGWVDDDLNPETPLTAFSVNNVPFGTPFEINLLTSQSALRAEIAGEIASGLSACGIKVNFSTLPIADLYQQAPEGPIFGRNFDLALVSIKTGDKFDCRWFNSTEIPAEENYWLGKTTGGANFYGYRNADYDALCMQYLESGLNNEGAASALQSALNTLHNDLPIIPLYYPSRAMLLGNNLCGVPSGIQIDDLFSFIEELSKGDGC